MGRDEKVQNFFFPPEENLWDYDDYDDFYYKELLYWRYRNCGYYYRDTYYLGRSKKIDQKSRDFHESWDFHDYFERDPAKHKGANQSFDFITSHDSLDWIRTELFQD